MKKQNKPKQKVIKQLAEQFETDLNKSLPITVQPNGTIVYKDYFIKPSKTGNWGVYHLASKDLISEFHLKSCALMAAKAHSKIDLNKFAEIKILDNKYWSNYYNTIVYGHNIKNTKDYDRYCIMLTRLEHSKALADHFKSRISTMFTWSFV